MENILLMNVGGIGDMLCATPAIRAVRKQFPHAWIALIGCSPAVDVLTGSPYVNEYIPFDRLLQSPPILRAFRVPGIPAVLDFVKTVRRRRWDALLIYQSFWRRSATIRPHLVALVSGAPIRAGLNTGNHGRLLTHKVPDSRFARRHYLDRFLDVSRQIGCLPESNRTEVWLTDKARRQAASLLAATETPATRMLIGIHPGANPSDLMRRTWPLERFVRVATCLVDRYQAAIVLTGTESERPLCRRLATDKHLGPHCIDLCGKTSVKVAAAVAQRCRLFISNDTGMMHLAVAAGTPTVGIFGPGDWQAYGTYPPEMPFRMVRANVDCWPCTRPDCTSRKCMRAVPIDDVIGAAADLLRETER